jgi:ADP-heptose:LPS heptosyltransferase
MSMDRMKVIDHYAGIPVCWILGLGAAVARSIRGRRKLPRNPARILVMKFFGIGHVLMASPLLRSIRAGFPDSRLIFLTFDSTAPLVRSLELVDEVRVIRTTNLGVFLIDVIRELGRMQTERIDTVIDLEFFSKFSTIMSILTRSPVRVGYYLETFWRDSIITHPVFFNYHQHVLDVYESTVNSIGLSMKDRGIDRLSTSADDRSAASSFLRENAIADTDVLIGINPNASDLSWERRWPKQSFVQMIDRLLEDPQRRVMLTGAPSDREYVDEMFAPLRDRWGDRVVNACARLSFRQFVAVVSHCDVFVTGDSGPMHVSVAQGVPTVSIWGPTNPQFHAPPGKHHSIVYRQMWCSPCLPMLTSRAGMWCDHRADCMKRTDVEVVLSAVENSLRNGASRSMSMYDASVSS